MTWPWPNCRSTWFSASGSSSRPKGRPFVSTADVSGSEVAGQYRLFFHAYASGTAGSTREMYADVLTIGSDGSTPHLSALPPAS